MGLSRKLFRGGFLTGGSKLRICVRFFALYGDLAGCDEEDYTLKSGSKVEDLINLVAERHKPMRGMRGMMIAVNSAFVKSDTALKDGDTVALLPPVSGG